MDTHLYLDLEDTIIESWHNPVLINVGTIRAFIDELRARGDDIHEVRIFSFAIYGDEDKDVFNRDMRPMIEEALHIPVVEWLSCKEQMELSHKWTGNKWVDVTDFIQCRGKHYAFFDVMQEREHDCTCILLDDCVPHMNTMLVPASGLTLQLVNVDKL